jgi:hypothetical protein
MTQRVDDRWFLPIEGVISGLFTCLVPALPLGLGRAAFLFVGVIFGLVISAHVRLFRGVRSAFRLIGFTATCTVAYAVSLFATVCSPFRPQFLNFSGTSSGAIDSSPFFTGGFVGAAIMCAGIFFFLAPPRTLTKFLLRAFSISVACGFLGVLGWSVGEQSWAVRWLPRFGNGLDFYTLYIIWQTGAASLLGLLLSPQQTPLAARVAAQSGYMPLQPKAGRATRSVTATIFLVLIFGTLAWFITRQVRGDLAAHRMQAARQAAQQQLAAARPASQNLPAIVAQPVDQVLVLKPIAGHPCGLHTLAPQPTGSPESVGYLAEYKLSETAAPDELFFADVEVEQYPNAAWAAYQTKEFMWDSAAQNPKAVTTVTKFGSKVIMNTLEGSPNGGGNLYFYWASRNWFVKVTFNVSEDDEFLKEYLALYPSAL